MRGSYARSFSSAQRAYDNMTPDDDCDDGEGGDDEDGEESEREPSPCVGCSRRGSRCLGSDCPI
jgi:hypothetical protein